MIIGLYLLSVAVSILAYKGFADTRIKSPPSPLFFSLVPGINLMLILVGLLWLSLLYFFNDAKTNSINKWIEKGYRK